VTLHLRAYDHGRSEPFRAISARLWKLCRALGEIDPALASWRGKLGDEEGPLDSERACDALVASSARMWRTGDRELVAYGPVLTATHDGSKAAALALVAGVAPLGLPVWIPNQVDLELFGPVETGLRADRPRLEAAFRAIVAINAPAWAVVEADGMPSPPVPPFSDGTPNVGWMTYLASSYPALPRVLPKSAVVHDLGTGAAIIAHASKPDAVAIDQLLRSLAEANVLVPAASVTPPSASSPKSP
jgi:hypothetical protein